LDETARTWLVRLGLCDATGKPRPITTAKFRQLERYLEILGHRIAECGWSPDRPINVVDMGCGKGHLTFGVWHLLNRTLELPASVCGIERRPELVQKANEVAGSVGARNLEFKVGDIASIELGRVDGLIALHACNTATDEAITRGVRAGARLIVVSPCCHQELRPLLRHPESLAPLLAHGILEERFSEWLTDGLRALRLEQAGYSTRVVEFVSSEHTPRNLLLFGVRGKAARPGGQARAEIEALKKLFGLGRLASDDIVPADGT
jgi:SAM-dependent methyltransferase